MATRTMTTSHSDSNVQARQQQQPPRRPTHHRVPSNTSSTSTAKSTTSRARSKERSHGNLTALHSLAAQHDHAGSSPEDEPVQPVARIGPKRKSKVGIAAMGHGHASGGGDLKRSKHDRGKGSTASLKDLEEARSRKTSGKDRSKLMAPEPNEDDWVSASGGESASQTPNVSAPGSPKPADGPPLGSTPTAIGTKAQLQAPSMAPQLSTTPKQYASAFPSRVPTTAPIAEAPKSAPLPPTDEITAVPFPSTSEAVASAPASPVRSTKPRTGRKPSTASVTSHVSLRSLRQPLSPSVALAPQVEMKTAAGGLTRSQSMSMGDGQAQGTMSRALGGTQSMDHSDLARKLREVGGTAPRNRIVSSDSTKSFSNLARLSTLRGLLPVKSSAPSPTRASPPTRHAAAPLASSAPRPPHQAFISKFISPSDLSPSLETAHYSTLPDLPSPPPTRTASTTHVSRTQQRLMLQRDAPFTLSDDRSTSPPESSSIAGPMNNRSQLIPPLSASSSPTDVAALNLPTRQLQCLQQQRDWARRICREAERVDREHECVLKFRDPAGESMTRVLAAAREKRGRTAAATIDKGKGKRPDSLQRSQTMR